MIKRTLLAGLCCLVVSASNVSVTANAPPNELEDLLSSSGVALNRTDIGGQDLGPAALQDHLAVVAFVSAGCTILCVTRTMDLERLAHGLPEALRGRVTFLAVGTDPADGPGRLRSFAEGLLGPASALRFLASGPNGGKALAAQLRYPMASLPEPPPTVLLFDRRGRVAMAYGGAPIDAERLRRDLAVLDTFTEGVGHPPAATSRPVRSGP